MRKTPTKTRDTLTEWSRDKSKTFHFHRHKTQGPQTLWGGNRIKRAYPTCHVTRRSRRHVTVIQYVVYICSTSSWSSLLKTDRFQMIMRTLKMCNLYKESFWGDVLISSCVFIWKKYPDGCSGSVSGIIYFCVYIKPVSSRQARHMFITRSWK